MLAPTRNRYGSLDCIQFDGGPEPSIAVVICHGYGAPGEDLASIGPEWLRFLGDDALSFRFVFPAAPLTLAEYGMPDGRAWWSLNTAQLVQLAEADQFHQIHDKVPPGMVEARNLLEECIAEVSEKMAGPQTPLVLGGFSQGAMLSMETSLRGNCQPPKVLFQFSGTLICENEWREHLSRIAGTRVYQSHGTHDPILPYSSAEVLHQLLVDGGVNARMHSFAGPHTIDPESIAHTTMMMKELV